MATWVCVACEGENPQGMRFCGHCGTPAPVSGDDADVAEALRSFVAGPVADKLVEAGGHLPAERRLITALFADVSGFTSLAERLDPEELHEVIDPVVTRLSSIVGRYGGYVEKFAGDALLALFGAPVSHEDDAVRSLLVALEMHRELDRFGAELPHGAELSLHVGVNSGHGIARVLGSEARMDYAVLGDSVILAQRLESAAPPGETYVSESTYRLTHTEFEFEPIGELTLKGKSEPTPCWRLVKRRDARVAARASRLIARQRELEAAFQALGSGGVVTVLGEPGVGKSRLAAAVRELAERADVRWLQTRCLSYGAALPYWPYSELLRAHGPADDPFVAELLGFDDGFSTALEPEAFRRRLHDAVARWLRELATDRPTILAVEDVHWADPSSLVLTADLAHLCADVPLSMYLVARPEAELRLVELGLGGDVLRLEPLGAGDVQTLVEDLLGSGAPPAELVDFVATRTGGNPFFVEEMVRSLQEAKLLVDDEGWHMLPGWDARTLPTTIEGVLSSRLDLLPRSAASVLQTAAVIGRRVGIHLLSAVHEDDDLQPALDRLVTGGFVHIADPDTVTFHHALIQDAAYHRLLKRRRRELHLRVAREAEALFGADDDVVDLLARHLYLGGAGEQAVDYLRRAGERARRLYANEEAILHFRRAAELSPGDTAIAFGLADLHELVGNYDEAAGLYRDLIVRTDAVAAWTGLAATHRRKGEYPLALDVVNRAFGTPALRDADLTPLWLEAGWSLSVAGRFEQAIDVLNAGIEVAVNGSSALLGQLLLQLARAETVEGELGSGLGHALEAVRILEQTEDLRGLTTALRILGGTYNRLERFDEAAATLTRGLELAERVGSVEEIGGCLVNLGLAHMHRGALEDAIACDRRAIEEFERVRHGSGRATVYVNLAEKLMKAGELQEALAYCERALELARSIGNSLMVAGAIQTMASIRLSEGDVENAVARAEEAARLHLEMGAEPYARECLEIAAEAWIRAGETDRARDASARARSLIA